MNILSIYVIQDQERKVKLKCKTVLSNRNVTRSYQRIIGMLPIIFLSCTGWRECEMTGILKVVSANICFGSLKAAGSVTERFLMSN